MSPTSTTTAAEAKVIHPDNVQYPWYQLLVRTWSGTLYLYTDEEIAKISESFTPLDELPPVFDPWSELVKLTPPTFYYGWPVDTKLMLEYARRMGLVYPQSGTPSSPTEVAQAESWTLVNVEEYLEDVVSLEQTYGSQNAQERSLLIWSLYTNWTPLDERMDEEEIAEWQADLGYKEGPKWYLTCSA
ncbi:hypothetical protein PUNSTDRAFT_146357 [Punctularia strigosozonata HHB-11173 SS5]|uniref:Uncharacterized protein n=1 Tax=Punctularia strigosozonata (strain HHB-11173) TaxID=741275 RepID=R7S5K6_PUNST|nr:uncharacterized protein PUNSTDRAFT_146357 [Punctularia strigosozonata HHB-11173 SS5]EIN04711.1 hypothetical protein PUNSTDRAFT_146357 [Punctularia strigosozonata HHB-11173 SS5]